MAAKKTFWVRHKLLIIGGSVSGLLLLLVLAFILAPSGSSLRGFATLADIQAYAKQVPELPEMDNTNMVRPDYTKFHRSQLQGYFSRKMSGLLSLVGLGSLPVWSPSYFGELLERSVTALTAKKMRKNVVYKVTPKPGTRFVVWGDILGAYHSLVRDLTHLKELGIIDENLTVTSEDTYLVFMGDVISRSPFGMETLSLVLRLLEVNPKNVIYLRGNHEDNKYWHAFGLKEQLQARASGLHDNAYVSVVDDLFMQLPLGLYLPVPDQKGHFARFSHLGRDKSKKLKEERFAHFLSAPQVDRIDAHQFSKEVVHNGKIEIDGIIRSEKKRHSFQTMDGIRLLEPDQGSTAWTILSTPTRVQQEGLKFFHDAFAIVQVGDHKGQWSITLHAQDVREMKGFFERSYQFFTGKSMTLEEIAASAAPQASAPKALAGAAIVSTPSQAPAVTASPLPVQPAAPQTRKVLRRVIQAASAALQPPAPTATNQIHVPAPTIISSPAVQPAQPITVQPQGNQAVSVTVTPPVAGAQDQSTIVSVAVKVPPASAEAVTATATMPATPIPTVTPVVRRATVTQDQESAVAATATRVEVLDQVEGS